MDHVEYVYTTGMTEADLEERLRAGENGVLALADGDESYAIPLSYHYDGDRFLLRVSTHGDESEKERFLETTDTATFVRYESTPDGSWSVLVRGPVEAWEATVDEATVNEWFEPFRLFDEAVDDVEFALYELRMDAVVGRETVD
jgi:hypothetical protein